MPLVQFIVGHTHDNTAFAPGEKAELTKRDAEWLASSGRAFIVSAAPTELQRLEAQSLVASKKSNCCFR